MSVKESEASNRLDVELSNIIPDVKEIHHTSYELGSSFASFVNPFENDENY